MTPAEFNEVLESRFRDRDDGKRFADYRNARVCEIIARCAGNTEAKTTDFLLFQWDAETTEPKGPEQLMRIMDTHIAARQHAGV